METQQNQANPVQPNNQAPEKKNKLYLVLGLVVLILIAVAGYFLLPKSQNTPNNSISNTLNPQPTPPTVQGNIGSTVDHATYLQIQGMMEKTPFSKPQVIESSLRSFDIDNDGDMDVLGFLKLTFSYDSNYLFSTWHRNATGFDYYEDYYDDFRLSEKYDGGLQCSIQQLATGVVTLACGKTKQDYLITLRYQKNGVGYYRDVDAHIVTFSNNTSWSEYASKKGGIQFKYPSDVQVSEKTYEIYGELITLITAKRNNQILFEIKTIPQEDNGGGGVIPLGQRVVFLKLSDGSYLSRNWMEEQSDLQETGVFYSRANAYTENNSGSIGESVDADNISQNRSYVLFTSVIAENNLKEIDNVFASIKYVKTPAIKDNETVILQKSPVSLIDIVTLEIPGRVVEHQPTEKSSGAVEEKDLEITFINSPIYYPSSLNLKLLPFGSVGDTNAVGGGGYNLEKNACFGFEEDDITPPQKMGANLVCRFGYGDGGFSSQGYYVLDSKKRYILAVTHDSSYSEPYETFWLDLEPIVESVRFKQ